jgi:hypothetical protein
MTLMIQQKRRMIYRNGLISQHTVLMIQRGALMIEQDRLLLERNASDDLRRLPGDAADRADDLPERTHFMSRAV